MIAICRPAAVVAAAVLALPAPPAQAQSAYEINRLNQAVQICNSPMGAGMAECARLRGQLGGGVPGIGGLGGGGKAAGIAGLLGAAMTASRGPQAAAPPPAADPGATQQAIATCVRNAGGNTAAIQDCLQTMNNNTRAGLLNAGASPQQLQTAGGRVPPGYAAPASNPFGALLPKR